jgi:hypothetical protein
MLQAVSCAFATNSRFSWVAGMTFGREIAALAQRTGL